MASTSGENYFLHAPMNAERAHLWVREHWSDIITDVVKEYGIRELHLKAWREPDLRFLSKIAEDITFLDIQTCYAPDISHVSELKRLKILWVHGRLEQIDFKQLISLENCNAVPSKGLGNLSRNQAIRSLDLSHCKDMLDLETIAGMSRLEELGFAETPLRSLKGIEHLTALKDFGVNRAPIASLMGIESVRNLRHLRLALLHKLGTVDPLATLGNLRELQIYCCKKVSDVSPLANLVGLNLLALEDNGQFETIRPFERLVNLHTLTFYGSTKIKDGDLSVLAELPRLRTLIYKKWPHYYPSFNEINEMRLARGSEPVVDESRVYPAQFDP